MEGILPIDKPKGMTSYDVIRRVKKIIPKGTKIGHAGTLDPFAEGLLIILLGRAATKQFDRIQSWSKTYLVTARLGASSDTLDETGTIQVSRIKFQDSSEEIIANLQKIIPKYVGEIEQNIPDYSAAKVGGQPRYKLARKGKVVPLASKKVVIYSIEVQRVEPREITLRVACGSGTYIRQLTFDLLTELGIESYLTTLIREQIGKIRREDCLALDELEPLTIERSIQSLSSRIEESAEVR